MPREAISAHRTAFRDGPVSRAEVDLMLLCGDEIC
jgi:hypothetical protein